METLASATQVALTACELVLLSSALSLKPPKSSPLAQLSLLAGPSALLIYVETRMS